MDSSEIQAEDVPANPAPSESENSAGDDTSVRVAIRIRPQNAREKIDLCQLCTTVLPEYPRQVLMGKDKSFTFDHVFDTPTQQDHIYNTCVRGLIEGCFEGFNATVFAYGQTGSGKTYTMGTGFDESLLGGTSTEVTDMVGIVPRAVDHLFLGIEERRRQAFENGDPAPDFKVTAQFMELYNEEILDLLDTTRDPESRGRKSHIRIHEDAGGGIYVVGVNTKPVNSLSETLQCLKSGALGRATASTNMNASSSRSHAIFTLHIRQQRVVKDQSAMEEDKETDSTQAEFETLTAKFHFVDLAGSERLKRTGATGDRAKEGISINCGLLALGNVISALGDKAKRGSHVPYRDSKLTRLLQDSLGGNSRTLMIACISPTDQDFMETLNTLKYANRARNIKNKVTANQDKASRQLAALRAEVAALTQELQEYKTGKRTVDADGVESVNDLVLENSMLQTENDKLRQRIKVLQDSVSSLQARSAQMLGDAALASLTAASSDGQASNEEVSNMIRKYIQEIEELKTKLTESESLCDQLRKPGPSRSSASRLSISSGSFMSSSWTGGGMETSMTSPSSALDHPNFPSPSMSPQHSVLHRAKKEMKRLRRLQRSQSQPGQNHESDKENLNNNNTSEVSNAMEESGVFGHTEDGQAAAVQRTSDSLSKNEDDIGDEEDDDEEEEDADSDSSSSSDSDSEGGGVRTYWGQFYPYPGSEVSDSDIESDNVHEDLANLTCEISIKQRLIEELEQTQRRMNSLRTHYEEKVSQLQTRIRETEMERDKVLSNIEKMSHPSPDGPKKVKQEFEKKLNNLQDELKKLQVDQRKHAKIQKNNSQYERHLKTLQHEIVEMKKTKVRLMKQVKEEIDKNKQGEARRSRELAQLRKEQLRRDNVIKALERQTVQKDAVLKRKQEEVEALRKRQITKSMSAKAAGRVGKYDRPVTIPIAPVSSGAQRRRRKSEFSPKVAKQKWDTIERNISSQVTKKQTITMLERDMNVWLKQREKCTKELQKVEKKEKEAMTSSQPLEVIQKLRATVADLSLKVEHAQENINECQSNIMQVEESKEDGEGEDSVEITSMVETMTLEEAKYMIRKLCSATLDKGVAVVSKDSEVKELQGLLNQTQLNNVLQQELLRHMMDGQLGMEVEGLMAPQDIDRDDGDYSSSSASSSPAESMLESGLLSAPTMSVLAQPIMQRSYPPPGGTPGSYDSLSLSRREKDSPPKDFKEWIKLWTVKNPWTKKFVDTTQARRKTTTPQDLLYAGPGETDNSNFVASSLVRLPSNSPSPSPSLPSPTTPTAVGDTGSLTRQGRLTSEMKSMCEGGQSREKKLSTDVSGGGQSSTSAEEETDGGGGSGGGGGGAGEDLADSNFLVPPPRHTTSRQKSNIPRQSPLPRRREIEASPTLARKVFHRSTSGGDSTTFSDATPPGSPVMLRRSGSTRSTEENVFSRLSTSSLGGESNRSQDKGYITPARGSISVSGTSSKSNVLTCTHTVEGHSRAVLAVHATDTLMLTGSKDRTAKLWDLGRGAELLTLSGHPNNVVKVAFCPRAQLAFTVSQSTVRVWDTRRGPDACIKTLSSSGLTTNGPVASGRSSDGTGREHQINDIRLTPDGTSLFCAAGNAVQIWDLRRYSQAGRLSGHQAPVMALALTRDGDNTLVISGSKDHYIKIFEVIEDAAGILTPKYNLEPPHYDGIQSLALQRGTLFSGSRDMCIKKWDLHTKQLKHSINAAHKDWVCALDFIPGTDTLVSGCRAGYLKLWQADTCASLGEIRAHSSAINAIATNTSSVFTASNDCVTLWRYRPDNTPTQQGEDSTSS